MYKVMIVDDMEIVRLQLKRLKIWGEVSEFQIAEEARNGEEALVKLETNPVDLIITDIRMPMVDGIELLEEVKRKKLAPCVVLLSEYSEFEYARQGLVLGAFDYIIKPINMYDIKKLLNRAKLFILEKKEEEKRIRVYSPELDITLILEAIKNGLSSESLAYSAFYKLISEEEDNAKSQHLIINFLEKLLEKINNNMPWFTKFADVSCIKNLNYHDVNSFEKLRSDFISCIQSLEAQISSLYLGENYGSLINEISTYVLKNVENELSLLVIANHLEMNKNYLCEIFKKRTGISLLDYMTKVKMERAKKLLVESENRSYEIADKIGYKDSEYFSKLFKKYTGVSPTKYRKLNFFWV